MKAVFFEKHGGNDVLQYGDRPTPEPARGRGPRRAAGRGAQPTRHLRPQRDSARAAAADSRRRRRGQSSTRSAKGVTGLAPGDRVLIQPGLFCGACEFCRAGEQSLCTTYRILGEHAPGTFAERVVVPARNVFPIPAGLSFEEAAAFPLAYQTAWRMIVGRAAVRAGRDGPHPRRRRGSRRRRVEIARLCGARVLATTLGPGEGRAPARGRGRARRRLREGGRRAGRARRTRASAARTSSSTRSGRRPG